ncbi:MAG TPA: NAD(P)/FAD-dependent oxidoreductase [Stellaceae bacterium]|nr:NAD(P)/FAD-dependent oxidoreductase [Stellaceae bacterium]
MVEAVEAVVVGAGVIGLAIARALAKAGCEVIILEKESGIGTETSSRNSEVIHAGIYYPTGSLKARACVEGKRLLYAYAAEHGVPHRRLGKLIVACREEEIAILETIRVKAAANGVTDLEWVNARELKTLEPALDAVGALLSPSTGIIDSHAYMLSLLAEAEEAGAMLARRAPLINGAIDGEGILLAVGGAEPMRLRTRFLVNAAGLHAPAIARAIEGLAPHTIPKSYFCRGVYFALQGRTPFRHLIYPVPESAGLGVHLTLDLGGHGRFGPDVEWIAGIDYTLDPRRAARFDAAIRRYWPGLPRDALRPDYAGIRPKISAPGEPAADFRIEGPEGHGVAGLVNLYGIESPGLTASLAIARRVVEVLRIEEGTA